MGTPEKVPLILGNPDPHPRPCHGGRCPCMWLCLLLHSGLSRTFPERCWGSNTGTKRNPPFAEWLYKDWGTTQHRLGDFSALHRCVLLTNGGPQTLITPTWSTSKESPSSEALIRLSGAQQGSKTSSRFGVYHVYLRVLAVSSNEGSQMGGPCSGGIERRTSVGNTTYQYP